MTHAARAKRECCAQTLNLMNCIIKFKNKFKTLLTPCNGLLPEHRDSNGSLARRTSTPFARRFPCSSPEAGGSRQSGRWAYTASAPCPQVKSRPLQAGRRGMHVSKVRPCLAPVLKSKLGFLPRLNDFS